MQSLLVPLQNPALHWRGGDTSAYQCKARFSPRVACKQNYCTSTTTMASTSIVHFSIRSPSTSSFESDLQLRSWHQPTASSLPSASASASTSTWGDDDHAARTEPSRVAAEYDGAIPVSSQEREVDLPTRTNNNNTCGHHGLALSSTCTAASAECACLPPYRPRILGSSSIHGARGIARPTEHEESQNLPSPVQYPAYNVPAYKPQRKEPPVWLFW